MLLTALMLLTACGEKPPFEVYEKPLHTTPYVPADLRHCSELPQVPGTGARQREVADYLTELHGVATECSTKLGSVDHILTKHEARVQSENAKADAAFEEWKKNR